MKKYVGILCGIVSAVSYGTNPLFGVPLLRVGYGVESMLFFRFLVWEVSRYLQPKPAVLLTTKYTHVSELLPNGSGESMPE